MSLGTHFSVVFPILKIIWIDILLSGDNALVIALACRDLPQEQRRWGTILGAAAAMIAARSSDRHGRNFDGALPTCGSIAAADYCRQIDACAAGGEGGCGQSKFLASRGNDCPGRCHHECR
jgi:hypothetical protein